MLLNKHQILLYSSKIVYHFPSLRILFFQLAGAKCLFMNAHRVHFNVHCLQAYASATTPTVQSSVQPHSSNPKQNFLSRGRDLSSSPKQALPSLQGPIFQVMI